MVGQNIMNNNTEKPIKSDKLDDLLDRTISAVPVPPSEKISSNQIVNQPPIKTKNKFWNKKKIFLVVLLLILIVSGVGFASWFLLSSNKNKLVENDFIANVQSCSKITELLKQTYEDENKILSDGSITSSISQAQQGGTAASSADFSTTNVQVEGVDEADSVKNDGEYIYTISAGNIFIVKAYPVENAKLVSKITLAEDNQTYSYNQGASEIFVNDNILMAIGIKHIEGKDLPTLKSDIGGDNNGLSVSEMPYSSSTPFTFIKIWDTSNKESLKLIRNVEFEGYYSTSRMIGDNVHVVLNNQPRLYNIVSGTDGNDLIPIFSDVSGEENAKYEPTCSCNEVEYFKNAENNLQDYSNSYVNVLSLSIKDQGKEINRRTIIGNSETVYASMNNLYLASVTYDNTKEGVSKVNTQFHKFNLKDDVSTYQTSANVEGTLLNQYSMDEYDGNFRVAATKGDVWDSETKSTNHVYVLDSNMKQIGSLDNLAPGERIYSSRFVGDRVYLVIYKKVDPFFVIDLKDPTKPSVLGFLKIPGYSDYLHPYDENHIIGIGKDSAEASIEDEADRNLDFAWYQGLKMAIFDVSDVNNPKELHKLIIGDRGTESPVLSDPKAFLFNKSKNLLALPIELYELTDAQKESTDSTYGEFSYQGAYVYNIDLENGFTLKGTVTHITDQTTNELEYRYSSNNQYVNRILYIDDYLYTISNEKIFTNSLNDLGKINEIKLQ